MINKKLFKMICADSIRNQINRLGNNKRLYICLNCGSTSEMDLNLELMNNSCLNCNTELFMICNIGGK
jgi:DNA-directed RNA polymerase subunit RPC12/RpoP